MGTPGFVESAAEVRFGKHSRPPAISLRNGHFDHVAESKESVEENPPNEYRSADEKT